MRNSIRGEISAKIRRLRTARGLTIEETAHAAGLHPSYLGEAERGRKNFSLSTLENIARALGVPLAELFAVKAAERTPGGKPDARLVSLLREAGPEEVDFLVRTAGFILKKKKKP
ncbi:MAG: transcriptional regulator yazB [Elusimicrobia bacterium]|nr:MAG: transcriptional regulator yazB [Elusimicrobiota bacterium]KAF0157869.1 MAG: transcriptional regulator yazB [Elusimicrobiota bacterium]